jgi:hypothetical protein
MTIDFNAVLDKKAGEIEKPPLIPPGTYLAKVHKIPEMGNVGGGQYDTVDFTMKLIEAKEDVDKDQLEEFGGLNNTFARRRFMFNKEDESAFKRELYNVKRFCLDHLKINGNDDTTIKELLNDSLNAECYVFMAWRQDKNDKDVVYSEIKKTAPIVD